MIITELHFADEARTRVEVKFQQDIDGVSVNRSGNWVWPVVQEGKREACEAWFAAQVPPLVMPEVKPDTAVSKADVDAERDRRINGDFTFNGKVYQCDEISRQRIDRARSSAIAAIQNGALPGDLRWCFEDIDFLWIAKDDSLSEMDAHATVAFGSAIGAREGKLILAARALKNMEPIPSDYATNEAYWPS